MCTIISFAIYRYSCGSTRDIRMLETYLWTLQNGPDVHNTINTYIRRYHRRLKNKFVTSCILSDKIANSLSNRLSLYIYCPRRRTYLTGTMCSDWPTILPSHFLFSSFSRIILKWHFIIIRYLLDSGLRLSIKKKEERKGNTKSEREKKRNEFWEHLRHLTR